MSQNKHLILEFEKANKKLSEKQNYPIISGSKDQIRV